MEDFEDMFCRLCLNIMTDKHFLAIEGVLRNVLNNLLPKLSSDEQELQVICTVCSTKLFQAYEFKSTCIDNEDNILICAGEEGAIPIDFKNLYLKKIENKQQIFDTSNFQICRLCVKLLNDEFIRLESITDWGIIHKYLPKVNFNATRDLVLCRQCFDSLEVHGEFLKQCLDTEKTIKNAHIAELPKGVAVKVDEMEIKIENDDKDSFLIDIDHEMVKIENIDYDPENNITTKQNKNKLYDIIKQSDIVKQTFKCYFCTFETESSQALKEHLLRHKYFSLSSELAESANLENQTEEEHFERLVNKYNSLISKTRCNVECEGNYKCDKCDYQAKRLRDIVKHQLRHNDPSEIQKYRCNGCDFQTKWRISLVRHQEKHKTPSEAQIYKCYNCDFQTKRKRNLVLHQSFMTKTDGNVECKGPYKCGKCDYQAKRKRDVARHELHHKNASDVQMYKCDSCDFQTRWHVSLTRHQVQHKDSSQIQMYKCHECGFQTKQKSNLSGHELKHKNPMEVRMYKCDKCDYRTKQKSNLAVHRIKHDDPSDIRMYKCGECDYETKHKSNLVVHRIKHKDRMEVKMCKCDKCDYQTKWKTSLIQHKKRTHKECASVKSEFQVK